MQKRDPTRAGAAINSLLSVLIQVLNPPGITNPSQRKRCPKAPAHGVPRHRNGALGSVSFRMIVD